MLGLATFVTAAAMVFAGTQPQLAWDGSVAYLVFGRSDVISVTRSDDGGDTFGPPVQLPRTGRMALGLHRGPRIAATGDVVLVSAIVGEKGGGADGDVLLYRSTDRGMTWTAPVVINDVPRSAREGLHAMAADTSGLVVIAWLDLRQPGTRVHAAVSRDRGRTWSNDRLVYASPSGAVCECCHPSVAIGADGRLAVMFRNNLAGNRDMYMAESADGATFLPARKLGTGSWLLNACPMDGGAISLQSGTAVSTWRRADAVYLSLTPDREQRLGTGRDPVLHSAGGRVDVAWSSDRGIVLWRSGSSVAIAPGRFPSLIALPDRTLVAWEQSGQVHVRAVPR
jgi:hypothetical protein